MDHGLYLDAEGTLHITLGKEVSKVIVDGITYDIDPVTRMTMAVEKNWKILTEAFKKVASHD